MACTISNPYPGPTEDPGPDEWDYTKGEPMDKPTERAPLSELIEKESEARYPEWQDTPDGTGTERNPCSMSQQEAFEAGAEWMQTKITSGELMTMEEHERLMSEARSEWVDEQ